MDISTLVVTIVCVLIVIIMLLMLIGTIIELLGWVIKGFRILKDM